MKFRTITTITGLWVILGLGVTSSHATIFTASGTGNDSQAISASANFQDLGGGTLKITLVNTAANSTYGIAETLYALNFSGATGLNLQSAVVPTGETTWNIPSKNDPSQTTSQTLASDLSVSSYWQYTGSGVSALVGGNQSYGLVSQGFDPLNNLSGGKITDGLANSQHNPYVQNTIVFTFSYQTLGTIDDVQFLYNTDGKTSILGTPNSPPPPSIPEPSTVVAGALLLLPFGISTLRIIRKRPTA